MIFVRVSWTIRVRQRSPYRNSTHCTPLFCSANLKSSLAITNLGHYTECGSISFVRVFANLAPFLDSIHTQWFATWSLVLHTEDGNENTSPGDYPIHYLFSSKTPILDL